ncbi:hypothetical protein [Tunturiibacter gelidoferens]|uniref:Uncharacterized protein n=1 Tax=Tunturiibacter gelidiferens TaxID=3069689 RepID=A0ACC5NTD7_9BACT|nr:hypothetical protein [Edaphobacter lichenicola]MBB5337837.1 hypothetical protein [Edaphobacter lichenicola]
MKAAAAAAVGIVCEPLAPAQPASQKIYYGKDPAHNPGQTPLDATNVYPLLAAWLLLTTNGPADTVKAATITSVANLDPRSTAAILAVYEDKKYAQSFSKVRFAFSTLAKQFANSRPYSGGQCPDSANTIAPVAKLP